METLQAVWQFVVEAVFPHWPGLFFIVFITILAQTLKARVFTKELAKRSRVIFWGRRVYPIILMLIGVIPGVSWPGEVYAGIDATPEKILYFMGCAGISILGFNVFKQWVKKKYDLDVEVTLDEYSSKN